MACASSSDDGAVEIAERRRAEAEFGECQPAIPDAGPNAVSLCPMEPPCAGMLEEKSVGLHMRFLRAA
jgi:hypothetical protein